MNISRKVVDREGQECVIALKVKKLSLMYRDEGRPQQRLGHKRCLRKQTLYKVSTVNLKAAWHSHNRCSRNGEDNNGLLAAWL